MKTGKTILVVCLIFSLLTSMTATSFALPKTATQQEKVKLLDDLRIFTGSNGDYRLNDQLSRSEAAALAVRIMGMELHVLLNSSTYRNTDYPDVDSAHWYAPYVGFCTREGILSGDASGNYKPNDFTTEKSFLKIMLSILGYEMNLDYTWNNIFRKAFEVGLVTDLSYIVKEEDNTGFKRVDAVNIIYNALTIKEKSADKELFYKLIDSGVLTREEAIEFGLIEEETVIVEDEILTDIEELLISDETSIYILFNEDIKSISRIKIYEALNEDKELGFSIEDMKEGYILLKTDKQTPGLEYTIEIINIEDTDGNIQEVLYTAFISTAKKTVDSYFFRIQKIEPVNEKSVKLFFTHPVNVNSENAIYYSITESKYVFASGERDQLLARTVNSEDHCVLLSLKSGTFKEGEQYTVEMNGNMTSAYGVRLNDGSGDEMAFKAIAGQADSFKVEEVIPYERQTILLSFNKEVNPFLAQQIYNFYVTDKNFQPIAIEKVTIESQGTRSGEVLFINIRESLKKDEKYYITINNLNDITRQEYITERTYSFIADYGTTGRLDLVDISPIDIQTIDVYFSNMLDQTTASNKDYYYVNLKNSTTKVYPQAVLYDKAIHPYKVTLFFNGDDLIEKKEYELKVNFEIKDYLGNKAGITLKESFKASTKEKAGPSIEEAAPISTDAVKLVFDKELSFCQTNLSPDNYTLEYNFQGMSIKKVPISVLYVNARTLVLRFDRLEYDVPYTLKFNALVDYSGSTYKVTGGGTNYVEFELEEK